MDYEALLSLMRHARNYEKLKSKDYHLNRTESLICIYLSEHKQASQEAIAQGRMLDKTTVAKSLKQLEKKGYVYRHANPENRRENLIFLTEEGRDDVRKIRMAQEAWLDAICEAVEDEKLEIFFEVIGEMVEQAEKVQEEEAAK